VLGRALVGTLDLIKRRVAGQVVAVLSQDEPRVHRPQMEASLQLSVYS
jgi:hypothetical protein